MGLDFQKVSAGRLAAAVHWGARAQFPAQQPLVALRMVVCLQEPPAEPAQRQVAKQDPQDEWVPAAQAQRTSRQLERLQAMAA
jgi:hypothetical protein